ncbi:hypothetical protein C8Q74DRAFT_1370411 [Fomes fomentarius]|nr:hypothetical protein C8Q74DRAFT_1370411 [Fomes fomentarius]
MNYWAKGLNAQLKAFQCNRFAACIIAHHDTNKAVLGREEDLLKPDMIITPSTAVVEDALDDTKKRKRANSSAPATEKNDDSDESTSCSVATMSWAHAETAIEVLEPEPQFPFDVEDFANEIDGHVQSRGSVIEYASELFRRGHREFVYTIIFCKQLARFQRFDRAAVVVSESFNYIERFEIIGEFLYRLFHDTVPQ